MTEYKGGVMISPKENKLVPGREWSFDESLFSLRAMTKLPKGMLKETQKAVAIARRFNEEVIRPHALEVDLQTHADQEYLPWDLVKKANEWGLYTMFIPKLFGGQWFNMPASAYVV
jgi:alkylation response protein AidB-like acyl-CoA dehydrogenase